MSRFIIHCDDPMDIIFASRALMETVRENRDQCGYGYERLSVFTKRNKTGWTAWVQRSNGPSDQ